MSGDSSVNKFREFEVRDVELKDLKNKKLGLYISLNRLSDDQMARLAAFLSKIEIEPIALAHSDATDDD